MLHSKLTKELRRALYEGETLSVAKMIYQLALHKHTHQVPTLHSDTYIRISTQTMEPCQLIIIIILFIGLFINITGVNSNLHCT